MYKEKDGVVFELVLTLIVVLVLTFGGWGVKEYKCAVYEDMTGMETKYKIFDGCYVKTDKGWFLREQLRDISVGQ
jgi:hypothetical protein